LSISLLADHFESASSLTNTPSSVYPSKMSSTNQPPGLSTAISTLAISAPDKSPPDPPLRRLAPHRKYAKKFLILPDELLIHISDDVAPEDLPNFRLTCKTLANIAAKHFGEKRLARRRFIFTWHSLKGLLDMTAHPVFGPCIKSIMFGTDHLTNQLGCLMDSLKSHYITDHAEAMRVLQMYHERWTKRAAFLASRHLPRMLRGVLTNLSSHGTSVSLGIFNDGRFSAPIDVVSGVRKTQHSLIHGYGSCDEYDGLPFVKLLKMNKATLRVIEAACAAVNFRPVFFEFDLNGQEIFGGMVAALDSFLLNKGQVQSLANVNICIRQGDIDVRVLSSRSLVEFEQRSTMAEELSMAEHCHLDLEWLGQPMLTALCATPITHLRIKSCYMHRSQIVRILQAFAETLQVVEMVDVAISGLTDFDPTPNMVLRCLRDDLHLQKLVLDDLRSWHIEYGDPPGYTIAKGRFWNGQQQVHAGLCVLLRFDGYGWDCDYEEDPPNEQDIRREELRVQGITYSEHAQTMDYASYLEYKSQHEEFLEDQKREYVQKKKIIAEAREAMARVEAGEFSV